MEETKDQAPSMSPVEPEEDEEEQSWLEELLDQIDFVDDGGIVPNTPIIATHLVQEYPEYLDFSADANIERSNWFNILLSEYQGLAALYLKLPLFEYINFGYVFIITLFYFLYSSYKNMQKDKSFVTYSSFFGTLVIFIVTNFVMIINQGILLFFTKAFGG